MEACWLICDVLVAWKMMTGGSPCMLCWTRTRKLQNLILLGFTEQVEDLLRRGPPSYLRELTDRLEAKGAATLERLQNWPVYDSLHTS